MCDVHLSSHDKALKGMGTLMAEACKEAKDDSMTIKQSFHHLANIFLNTVKSPVMEACYIIVTNNTIINQKGILTCRPNEWVFIAKGKETLQQLQPNSEDVRPSDNIDKYGLKTKDIRRLA